MDIDLTNLQQELGLAAQDALVTMVDYIENSHGYYDTQAWMIVSVAVALRIAQFVDVPNAGVIATSPLEILVEYPDAAASRRYRPARGAGRLIRGDWRRSGVRRES